MRLAAIFCLLFIAPLIVVAQNPRVSLLAAECEAIRGVCEIQHLVRYQFQNGVMVSRDVILSAPVKQISYNLGENHIYRNRYVITNWGDIIDIQNKKQIHNGEGEYVATEGDRIFHHLNNTNVKGYFYYDLKTNRYARLRGPTRWALPGTLSPDQTKSVEGHNDEIWLHSLKQKKRLLGSGFTVQAVMEVSFMARPPVFWLDNDRILSQRKNGEIVVVQLDGSVTPIVKIPITERNYSEPDFFRDRDGRVIYACCGASFVINVDEKSYAPHEWSTLGFGFDVESETNPSYGHVIRYKGKEIGKLWASLWGATTNNGYVAFLYGDVGSNLGYPKGIKVWSSANGEWTTIDPKWVTRIIGWIHE
jgi:hypothetical protein